MGDLAKMCVSKHISSENWNKNAAKRSKQDELKTYPAKTKVMTSIWKSG